jgi:hypothetical protein
MADTGATFDVPAPAPVTLYRCELRVWQNEHGFHRLFLDAAQHVEQHAEQAAPVGFMLRRLRVRCAQTTTQRC